MIALSWVCDGSSIISVGKELRRDVGKTYLKSLNGQLAIPLLHDRFV